MGKDCWKRIDGKELMEKDWWERIDGKGLLGKDWWERTDGKVLFWERTGEKNMLTSIKCPGEDCEDWGEIKGWISEEQIFNIWQGVEVNTSLT